MKYLLKILRATLILALAIAPLGGVYAGTENSTDSKTHCSKMGHANMNHKETASNDGAYCPHHDKADNQHGDTGMKCDKDCGDCKATHHVASLSHCPMHSDKIKSQNNASAGSTPHTCPHHENLQPPKH